MGDRNWDLDLHELVAERMGCTPLAELARPAVALAAIDPEAAERYWRHAADRADRTRPACEAMAQVGVTPEIDGVSLVILEHRNGHLIAADVWFRANDQRLVEIAEAHGDLLAVEPA